MILNYEKKKRTDTEGRSQTMYSKKVSTDKVLRILESHGGRTILIVNRLTNEAIPVVTVGQHYYFRTRDRNQRFIWKRHIFNELMQVELHRDMWDSYFYFIDYEKMLKDNIIQFGGEKVEIAGEGITLSLNP